MFRDSLLRVLCLLLVLFLTFTLTASPTNDGQALPTADRDDPKDGDPQSDETSELALNVRKAVDKALVYLAHTQKPNGSWLNDVGYKLNYSYIVTTAEGRHPGVTAIACLAFMANGHYPGRGQYGDVVRKGLNFIMSCISEGDEEGKTPGFITWDGSRMYSHAFATLFLAQILGMANFSAQVEELIRSKLRLAVNLIITSQNRLGAWRYQPNAPDADMSIAVCQLQALRAARNVGFKIPVEVISRARSYIAKSYQMHDDYRARKGMFKYQYDNYGTRATWTLTAAGVCAMQQSGQYDSFTLDSGAKIPLSTSIDYLLRYRMRKSSVPDFDYFYGYYYASQAIYQYSREHKEIWSGWLEEVRTEFLNMFRPTVMNFTDEKGITHPVECGYWQDKVGKNYATAMASLILQIHHEYLPIFQK